MNELSRLEAQALVVDDFDEAADALLALKTSDATRAKAVALRILREDIGDVYYQAGAFDVLYGVSAPDAVRYMDEVAPTVHPYTLGEMLTLIAVDIVHFRCPLPVSGLTFGHELSIRPPVA